MIEPLFERVDPLPPAYPNPWFPMLPILGISGAARDSVSIESRFAEGDALFTSSGSAAIFVALLESGVRPGEGVAVPSYHCPSMVAPILAVGATPLFIPVGEDLSISVNALEHVRGARIRAVILPHYFGFAQPQASRVREWCDAAGAILVEDCAHAFVGVRGGFVPGRIGHFAVASVRKFFAGVEGGVLVSNSGQIRTMLSIPGWRSEVGCWRQMLAESVDFGALRLPLAGRRRRPVRIEGPADEATAMAEAVPAPLSRGEIEHVKEPHGAPKCMTRRVRESEMLTPAGVRRSRYARWQRAIFGVERASSFADRMPDSGVPYVFPVLLTQPREQYRALKYARLQAWRWDRLAVTDCAVSRSLGASLIQLPCCPSLTDSSFDELVMRVCEELDAR